MEVIIILFNICLPLISFSFKNKLPLVQHGHKLFKNLVAVKYSLSPY